MGEIGHPNRQPKHCWDFPPEGIHAPRDAHPGHTMPTGNMAYEVIRSTWYTRISSLRTTQGIRKKRWHCHISQKWYPGHQNYRKWICTGCLHISTRWRENMGGQRVLTSSPKFIKTWGRWRNSKKFSWRRAGQFPTLNCTSDLRGLERPCGGTISHHRRY